MGKSKKLLKGTLLTMCFVISGCSKPSENPIKEQPKEYEFQYLISDSKVMETSDIGTPVDRKTHLYLRAWDSVRPEIIDGKRGMQAGGEYTYDNFVKVLQPDTHMISTDLITGTTSECAQILKAELDEFFKNNGENDISYVSFGSHGDMTGGLALFDGGVTGPDAYSHVIYFNTIVDWLKEYKGRFFIFLSACFSGRWLDPNFSISTEFVKKLDACGDKFTIITEASTSNLYTPYYYGNNDTTAVISSGLVPDENNRMPADLNKDGNVTVEEMYLYGRVNWTGKGTDCHLYAPNRENEVFFENRTLELYSTTSGSFGEGAKEKLLIKIPTNKRIDSIGMPTAKEGYKFTGWSYDKEGKNIAKFPLILDKNTKLFANYECKEDAKTGYISASQYDTIRIPYKDGTYGDFTILDFKTNDNQDGMYVVSKNIAGMTAFPRVGQTSYYFNDTAAQDWCHEYARRLFPNKLDNLISPSNAVLGSNLPDKKLENEKVFFLSWKEVQTYFPTESSRKLDEDYFLRCDNSTKNHYINTYGNFMSDLAKSKTTVKGTRPAMNLNISKEDLVYEPETETFYIKSIGRYIKKATQRYNGTYQVKVDGEVIETISGNRKLACDNMNTLASTYWETSIGFTYAYSSEERFCYKAGNYRGLVYNELNREFYDYENMENCIDGIEISGTDSSAAISASYSLTFNKKFTAQDMTCPGSLYNEKNFAADAVTNGTGSIKEYKDVGKVKHLDYVSVVGNPTLPLVYTNDTNDFLNLLVKDFENNNKTIHEEVFSHILPGDMIVSRFTDAISNEETSHTRLITGVEIVHDNNKIDPELSKVIFADAASPLVGRFIYGGQKTSFLTSDVYSKNSTNTMTFNDLLTTGYIPVTLNNWETGY